MDGETPSKTEMCLMFHEEPIVPAVDLGHEIQEMWRECLVTWLRSLWAKEWMCNVYMKMRWNVRKHKDFERKIFG